MRWPAAMVFAAAWAAGCHSAPPVLDPFFPRTRIPPPATGAATGSGDALYTSPAPPMTGSAPSYSPGTTFPNTGGSNGLYAPPGGYQFQQVSPTPATGGYAPIPGPVNRSSQFAPSQGAQVVRASHVTTVDDEPSAVYERGRQAEPAQAAEPDDSSAQTVDIMELPSVSRTRR